MKVITNQLYEGCYEKRVYPFANADTDMRKIIGDGYVRVLFVKGEAPRILFNCSLGELSVEDVAKFQRALDHIVWLVDRDEHIKEPASDTVFD